jgi:hypothetical protein
MQKNDEGMRLTFEGRQGAIAGVFHPGKPDAHFHTLELHTIELTMRVGWLPPAVTCLQVQQPVGPQRQHRPHLVHGPGHTGGWGAMCDHQDVPVADSHHHHHRQKEGSGAMDWH